MKNGLMNRVFQGRVNFDVEEEVGRLQSRSAFVLGNGPSLREHNLEMISPFASFASNAIYYIFDSTSWRPDYYACVDTAVLPDQADSINYWTGKLRQTKFAFPRRMRFHDDKNYDFVDVSKTIYERNNVSFFDSKDCIIDGGIEDVFAGPDDNGFVQPMTVTITLMQMAVRFGAKRIFIIGCDNAYVVPENARILDQESDRVDKRIILDADNDPNHFDSRYFGKGKVWHTPNVHLMNRHYERAYEACQAMGVEVFNAGIGGELEVFPRISYEEAIRLCEEERKKG